MEYTIGQNDAKYPHIQRTSILCTGNAQVNRQRTKQFNNDQRCITMVVLYKMQRVLAKNKLDSLVFLHLSPHIW